jgi:hypothetical protein
MFGSCCLRQGVSARIALALAVGAAGAIWVIFRADWVAIRAFEIGPGEAIFFWGCVAHAAYTPLVRLLNRGEPILAFSFLTLAACAAILLIWGGGRSLRRTGRAAAAGLGHADLRRADRQFDDGLPRAIRRDAPAVLQGDGLHLPDAVLGPDLGTGAGPAGAAGAGSGGGWLSFGALALLLRD